MLDKPDSLINSSDISMVAQYNLGPTAEPSEESSGNLEIRINWLRDIMISDPAQAGLS